MTGRSTRLLVAAASLALAVGLPGCATVRSGAGRTDRAAEPGRSVTQTIQSAIALLERYQCATVAVDFLSPIKRARIADLEAYRRKRQCSPDDRGNLDEVLLALRLALGAEPEIHGIKATIDLSGIGLTIPKLEFVRYTDGRWYFNEL
jgi:hypothetical protein